MDLDENGNYPPITRHIRVSADLADMLAWISRLKRLDTGRDWRISEFVDPFIRPQVEAEYARTFLTWCFDNGFLDGDPMRGSKSLPMGGRATFERRALTRTEIDQLIVGVGNRRKTLVGMSGPDRQALYACAIYSGMRVGELASLTRDSFHLDNQPPYLTVRAGNTKSKKQRDIPVPAEIARLLKAWLETRPRVGNVWPTTNWTRGGAGLMLRRDLKACGIAEDVVGTSPGEPRRAISSRKDQRPKGGSRIDLGASGSVTVDFHALRTTYATLLATSGVSIQHAQRLLGHSNPVLTMKHYTKLTIDDLGDQVGKIQVGTSLGG